MSSVTCLHTPTKKPKIVNVVLLDGSEYPVYVDVRSKFQEVFNQVASHLSLRETEYFGLALKKDDEYQFLVLDEKIHKQAPKRWKTGEGEGFDCQGQLLLTVWFRVQFYVDQTVLLREKITRHLYYTQLQENFIQYEHCYSVEKCFQLVGYTLQADFGNFMPDKHKEGYFNPRKYFPAWIIKEKGLEFITKNAPVMHKDLHNMTRNVAELKFIREVSGPPSEHNLHFYKVKRKKTDKVTNMWLAICAKGVQVYENLKNHYWRNLIATFPWPDIGKLYFDKNKFEIRFVGRHKGRKFAYYTDCDEKSKYLLYFCRTTHMFQMAIQPKLMEIRHLDAEDQRRYRESYIYSDANDLVANGVVSQYRTKICPKKSKNNRYSVISDGSSATSSGIVSDKMPSFDESEEHKEIMIDSPPYSLMGTPGKTCTKFRHPGILHNFSPVTRSPGLAPHSLDLYKPVSSGKGGGHSPTLGAGSLGDRSPVGGSGSYPKQLHAQQTPVLYTDRVPGYHPHSPQSPHSPHTPSSPSEHAKTSCFGHSVSRTDSFNKAQTLLQIPMDSSPVSDSKETAAVLQEQLSPQRMSGRKVSSTNDSAYASIQASLNLSYTAPSPFLQPISSSGVTTLTDNLPSTSGVSGLSQVRIPDMEMQLKNAQEVYVPQSNITEGACVSEIPEDPVYSMQSVMVPSETVFTEGASLDSAEGSDGFVLLQDTASEKINTTKLKVCAGNDGEFSKSKKAKPAASGKCRQGLHPELEEIRDQSHAHSLPLITALCNDLSLMHTATSNSNGSNGGGDLATMKSSDSCHSEDSRRWSINHLHETDTMITFQTSRPYSWNCPEHFNVDGPLPLSRGSQYQFQKVFECSSLNPTSSWTSAIACSMPHTDSLDRCMYFPELIAQ